LKEKANIKSALPLITALARAYISIFWILIRLAFITGLFNIIYKKYFDGRGLAFFTIKKQKIGAGLSLLLYYSITKWIFEIR